MLHNIFAALPPLPGDEEIFQTLLSLPGMKIERIISTGQASPPGFWYDQEQTEWVIVLKGHASLRFADESEPRTMVPGDFVTIPAHRRHRVDWTDPNEHTVWLAVHHELTYPSPALPHPSTNK